MNKYSSFEIHVSVLFVFLKFNFSVTFAASSAAVFVDFFQSLLWGLIQDQGLVVLQVLVLEKQLLRKPIGGCDVPGGGGGNVFVQFYVRNLLCS